MGDHTLEHAFTGQRWEQLWQRRRGDARGNPCGRETHRAAHAHARHVDPAPRCMAHSLPYKLHPNVRHTDNLLPGPPPTACATCSCGRVCVWMEKVDPGPIPAGHWTPMMVPFTLIWNVCPGCTPCGTTTEHCTVLVAPSWMAMPPPPAVRPCARASLPISAFARNVYTQLGWWRRWCGEAGERDGEACKRGVA